MSLTVKNHLSKKTIRVAINSWGTASNTTYYSIEPNKSVSWSRSDSRGFVMYIIESILHDGPYYVLPNSTITVHQEWVEGATKISNMPKLQEHIEQSIANVITEIEE